MMRRLAGPAMVLLLAACGGDGPVPPGAMTGSYLITSFTCGGEAGPPLLQPLLTAPNSDRLVSADGYAMVEVIGDGVCTISTPWQVTYSGATVSFTGAGHVTCSPSAEACATLSHTVGLPDGLDDVCGVPVNSRTSTFSHTSVPAAGGTMTLTATGGPASLNCEVAGLTGPYAVTLRRE